MKKFCKAATIRAVRTMCQTAVALIPTTNTMIGQVNWGLVISSALLAGFLSIMNSIITGLPEVENDVDEDEYESGEDDDDYC